MSDTTRRLRILYGACGSTVQGLGRAQVHLNTCLVEPPSEKPPTSTSLNSNSALSRQQRYQLKNGRQRSIVDVEFTPERASQHRRDRRRRARTRIHTVEWVHAESWQKNTTDTTRRRLDRRATDDEDYPGSGVLHRSDDRSQREQEERPGNGRSGGHV